MVSEESEMLADSLAKAPDFFVIHQTLKKVCLLPLSALSWLKKYGTL